MSGLWFNFSAKGGSLVSEDGGKTWRKVTDDDIERIMSLPSSAPSPIDPPLSQEETEHER